MAITRLLTTVLPYSADPASPFHVSLHLSHRLEGGDALADYPAMVNWVATLATATFELYTDSNATPIPCTPLLSAHPDPRIVVPSESDWATAFPPSTTVTSYPTPVVTSTPWRSFPAHRMRDHALDVHYASLCSSPVNRPGVLGNPLAESILDVIEQARPRSTTVPDLRRYPAFAARRRNQLDGLGRTIDQSTVHPSEPTPTVVDPPRRGPAVTPTPTHIAQAEVSRSAHGWRSPIEILLDDPALDSDLSAYLDRLVANPGLATTPTMRLMADTHAAQRYYRRTEAEKPYQKRPVPGQSEPPRTPHPTPDFHARAASTANVPALARALGFVVDVRVDDLDALRAATRIRCEVRIDGVQSYVSPETVCTTDGSAFAATPQTDRWRAGRLTLGDPTRYRVMDLDPDAAGLSLEQHVRATVRELATETNGDRSSFAPSTLRATGFCLAELNRPDDLKRRLTATESVTPEVAVSGVEPQRRRLTYEDLQRGTRIEVWDDVTRTWHSLHRRRVSVSVAGSAILDAAPDTGFLHNPPISRVPGDDANPYYVHEVLAGWDGWSLSAPRPGKMVIHKDGEEVITDTPETVDGVDAGQPPGLEIRSTAETGSLPALRYGRRYAFRIAGVDLAGNSVPMSPTPSSDPDAAALGAAAAHLDTLRASARTREQSGVFASLRSSMTEPTTPIANAHLGSIPADVARATTSAIRHSSAGHMNPQVNTDPTTIAELSAGADPTTISTPRPFLRWDAITPPTLVPRVAYSVGESLQRMVIRTGLSGSPEHCERHIVPPKGSQLEAELDGRFDALMATPTGRTRAYAIALKERGSLFDTEIQSLKDPHALVRQERVFLKSTPGATDLVTLEELQNLQNLPTHDVQPGEGQYVVHDVDDLVVPYLPDPMANGVALVFYEAGTDHDLANPRILQSVTIRYAGVWPEISPLRLVVHDAPQLDARQDGNVIKVGLPPGEQVAVALSTTLDADHLEKMGLWRLHPIQDPNVPATDRDTLAQAARDGWLWWLTPDTPLRLVHATARPARPPMISRLAAEPRPRGGTAVSLDGVLDVHGHSTDKVTMVARWNDLIDDPNTDEPQTVTSSEIVVDHRIGTDEQFSLLTLSPNADTVGARRVETPVRSAIHKLTDTKARSVNYQLSGTSRYREFFTPDQLPADGDPQSAGNTVTVNIPSSAPPDAPIVHSILPLFAWEQTGEPAQPFAARRIRRSGVRIWLHRPWFSSGDGEMLAVFTSGRPGLTADEDVSLWARDPIIAGPRLANTYEVPVLPAWQQRAAQLALTPQEEPGRPFGHVVKAPTRGTAKQPDQVVNAYLYRPEFDHGRALWFVDIILDGTDAIWPFLRLSIARYQPNSIAGAEFSETVVTDFVPLPPERITTVSRPDDESVRVTMSGVSAVTVTPGTDRVTRPVDDASLFAALSASRRVTVRLQARDGSSTSDLEWTDVRSAPCEITGADLATFRATWSATLPLDTATRLQTPGTTTDMRILIEEYELLAADPRPGHRLRGVTERLIYADHLPL